MESIEIQNVPVLSVVGTVPLPESLHSFEVEEENDIKTVEFAWKNNKKVFLINKIVDENNEDSFEYNQIGIYGKITQIITSSVNIIKIIFEPLSRAMVISLNEQASGLYSNINCVFDEEKSDIITTQAYLKSAKIAFHDICMFLPNISEEVKNEVLSIKKCGKLADYIAANLQLTYEHKIEVLNETDTYERIKTLIKVIKSEIEIITLERDIDKKVKQVMDKNQREYYLREEMRIINNELNGSEFEETDEYRMRIAKIDNSEIQNKLFKEVSRLETMPFASQEAGVIRTYLDTCLELPWNYKTTSDIDINSVERILNKDHYGLEKVKERILEYLAVKKYSDNVKAQIICLAGPPGVGKTSIGTSLAKALQRNFARISLGGISDEAEIRGHRKTYLGSMPGRIINAVKKAGSMNPVILLDEIDKMSSNYKGDPSAALLEALDPEQNKTFRDHYIEMDFDLSDVLFITTANSLDTISKPLLDRMEVIEIPSYSYDEKLNIAQKHLIPKQLKNHGLSSKDISISKKAVLEIIEFYTKEAGVRALERNISKIMRKTVLKILRNKISEKINITPKNLEEYLGAKIYQNDKIAQKDEVGVATGLAWTSAGGEVLKIEVNVMNGTGKTEFTGSLGDVMKESCFAAVSYIRANAEKLNIAPDFYKNKDIHIHFPAGAVPKDGPSAGITIASAIISELTSIKIRHDTAMTGEITIHGNILAIGGLREKAMAAYKYGIKRILIPSDNISDIRDVADVVKRNVEIIAVDNISEVLKNILVIKKNNNKAFHILSEKKKIYSKNSNETIMPNL